MPRTEASTHDEAIAEDGEPRPHYAELLAALGDTDLEELAERVDRHLRASRATFREGSPLHLAPVPRLVAAAEWAELETGLAQRVRALDAFVEDLYGERAALTAGVVPESVLAGIEFLEADLVRAPPPPGAWIGIAGLDVVRDADGTFRVLEDNVRTPAGMADALVARQALAAHLPYDGRWRNIRAELATYLRMVVAAGRPEPDQPGIAVMLSDGPSNSAWGEPRELAELAELRMTRLDELTTENDRLLLRDGRRVQ